MMELLASPEAWVSLATLSVLEIVLGIDNIIFLSIVTNRLPKEQQPKARFFGLALALVARLALLFSLAWMTKLTAPIFFLGDFAVSWRDLVLFFGGAFLIYKGTDEMHEMLEGQTSEMSVGTAGFTYVIFQIMVIDMVFSLDSVITAIGIAEHLPVMVIAILIAIAVMLLAAAPVAGFVDRHPTVKMLALAFLLLVGAALVADGLHFHIPRAYLYFAIGFSIAVEALNLHAARARDRRTTEERSD
ncbi:MAG: TerC family protein [Alphaproteobacteria bacterium]|nr:TerC family protein [Alphaproteobacteria bacterium]